MFGKASVFAIPCVVDLAVSWLSVSFTILMNIYTKICNDNARVCALQILLAVLSALLMNVS